MKKYMRHAGMATVCSGSLLLLVGYAFSWTDSNIFLVSTAALVVVGAVLHVCLLKKDSRY